MMIVLFFVVMPLVSLTVNYITKRQIDEEMANLIDSISKNNIHVLEIEGHKASSGMLYVQNAWGNRNVINLRIRPAEMTIHNDTLRVVLDDRSDVYQGAIMLANLQYVIRNGKTTKLREN